MRYGIPIPFRIYLSIGLIAVLCAALACGPAAQSEPGPLTNVAPPAQESEPEPADTPTPEPENTPEPTPQPTRCATLEEPDGTLRDFCITPSPPSTPEKIGLRMKEKLQEAEQSSGAGGASGEAETIRVTVHFGNYPPECEVHTTLEPYIECVRGYTDPVLDYLRKNNVELPTDAEEMAYLEIWATPTVIRAVAAMDPVTSVTPKRPPRKDVMPQGCVFDEQQGGCQ